ncbi:MAG: 2-hydroxyacid dehydrogenase [Pseudomonadota bacterium]
MSKNRVLQVGPITPPLDAKLPGLVDIHPLWKEKDPQAFLAAHGQDFEGIVLHVRDACPAALINALPNLRVISNFGVGYDKIDVAAAHARGVQVANTPKVLDNCVADLAIGLLIDVARGLSATDRFVRRGEWAAGKQRPLMTRVSGKKIGILGFGGIGQAIARRAAGFDTEVRYNSRKPVKGHEAGHVPDLKELAAWSDFLVVACPGGPATKHLVSADVLNALGKDGILVNIARGSVVDEAELIAALQQGRIAGAGLDVFENEPKVPEALMAMENVVLMSHIAGFTRETRLDMEQLVCDNLVAYFNTGKVLTPVA